MDRETIFLIDRDRPSYVEAADLYREAFRAADIDVREEPYAPAACATAPGAWMLHHTIGPLFQPVAGAINTAVVFHEWDRYPAPWVATLNAFQSVWAPSSHVVSTLRASGVTTPIDLVPPPVAARRMPPKTSWTAPPPFRLLAIGDAHFRKGFHLLIDGFMRAFPASGEAMLTLKVSASCAWRSPRTDIVLIADRLDRGDLLSLYRRHDAYVTASLGEGLGLPVAEAVLAGLPVVANAWGGHCDLVQPADMWPIAHEIVPQVFCSDPSYYADGQRCAYSSADQVAAALRAIRAATPAEREARSRRARAALLASHGVAEVAALVQRHRPSRLAAPARAVDHARAS
ncbi:MAG TPA: glycosyltransferase [Vicinamibacterales bacterium]|jgi:glycosyltransferase involved in cell wall biosynthesis|nr:glycosyltransferase [Vicinamibacterales bacterium]